MNFQVPQFIEVEDKIFGPLTFKQFIYIAGGLGIAFLFYAYLPRFLAVIPILAVIGFALALAFFRVNNRPFIHLAESAFRFLFTKKLYLWKRRPVTATSNPQIGNESAGGENSGFNLPRLSGSRLKDLSWSLDIKESLK